MTDRMIIEYIANRKSKHTLFNFHDIALFITELTRSKTILEITVEIKPQPVAFQEPFSIF